MEYVAIWLLAILYVEAVSEIITTSVLFFDFRDKVATKWPGLPATLVTCGYCMSVWAALTVGFFLPGTIIGLWVFDGVVKTFALHRLSNLLHVLMNRRLNGEPFQLVIINAKEEDDEINGRTEESLEGRGPSEESIGA